MDPDAVRRKLRVIGGSRSEESCGGSNSERPGGEQEERDPTIPKRRKVEEKFGYPINIALHHNASDDVIDLLLREGGPDVLAKPDGPDSASTLAIAIALGKSPDVIKRILKANPRATQARDRYENLPLHYIVRTTCCPSRESVNSIYRLYSKGLRLTNFHGHTPLDLAVRNEACSEGVLNFLHSVEFKEQEDLVHHLDDIID
jgi:hypothetical protein